MSRKSSERKSNYKNNIENPQEFTHHRVTLTKENILENTNINLKCKTENQKKLLNLIKEKEVIICSGPAGCGKTYLSCAEAIKLLKLKIGYDKIVLIKSVITLKTEDIGYIKGSIEDKMEPVIYSFINNFEKLIGKEKTEKLKEFGLIEVLPIGYLRGINIDNALVIIDEVQNINIDNIRTILTRLGTNSKMILLGDYNQIDSKSKKDTALKFLLDKFKDIEEIGTLELGLEDVVRNPLIKKIEPIFIEYNKAKELVKQPNPNITIPKITLITKLITWIKSIIRPTK